MLDIFLPFSPAWTDQIGEFSSAMRRKHIVSRFPGHRSMGSGRGDSFPLVVAAIIGLMIWLALLIMGGTFVGLGRVP